MLVPDRHAPPHDEEVEVSLFGPGVGECVVVHVGGGDWIVVDSCTSSKVPVALSYLEALGVDVATRVKLVVVTHWHDDHIRGIADVFRRAKAAELVCSTALGVQEFFELVSLARAAEADYESDVNEFASLYAELVQRLPPGARNVGATPRWAIAGRPLLRVEAATTRPAATVTAMSPSDVSLRLAHISIGERLNELKTGQVVRRLVASGPNEASIVLWVSVGSINVLLGSDLEDSSDPRSGWKGIVADHSVAETPRAHVLKVPHHGSVTADYPGVWTRMLHPDAVTALTPFRRCHLPQPADLQRLKARTTSLYVTADPVGRKPPRRDAVVDRTMREVAKERRVLRGPMGHVRLRLPASGGAASVALFDGAYSP